MGYLTRPSPAPVSRSFTVLSFSLEGVDEATAGVPHDVFVPDQIVVNRGDTVTITFINTEDVAEDHTFTMAAPYAANMVLGMGERDSFTFTANTPGVFAYLCTFHQPTMTGYLIVLG